MLNMRKMIDKIFSIFSYKDNFSEYKFITEKSYNEDNDTLSIIVDNIEYSVRKNYSPCKIVAKVEGIQVLSANLPIGHYAKAIGFQEDKLVIWVEEDNFFEKLSYYFYYFDRNLEFIRKERVDLEKFAN